MVVGWIIYVLSTVRVGSSGERGLDGWFAARRMERRGGRGCRYGGCVRYAGWKVKGVERVLIGLDCLFKGMYVACGVHTYVEYVQTYVESAVGIEG